MFLTLKPSLLPSKSLYIREIREKLHTLLQRPIRIHLKFPFVLVIGVRRDTRHSVACY